jgi:aryl sulfotransferase
MSRDILNHYVGPITDTHRWASFKHRPDDIFICTPPKSGTTWTQAICAMLVFGRTDHGEKPAYISPWVDANLDPLDEYLRIVDAQQHRRFIKTHTPLDGIPFYDECQYLAIFRDPRDAFLSGSDHRDNMTNQELANTTFPSGENAFSDWLHEEPVEGGWDRWTLAALVHLFRSYWQARDLENVHLFHYADMQRDLPGAIAAMASALGYQYTDEEIAAFADAASFDRMKDRASQFAPQADVGFWRSDSGFFATAGRDRWKNAFSEEQNEAFQARATSLLEPEAMEWLLNGNG